MFGVNDNTQQSNDDPAMLDNVKQLVNDPAYQVPQPQYMTSSSQPHMQVPTLAPTQTSATDDQTPIAEPAQGFSTSPMPEPPEHTSSASNTKTDDADHATVTPIGPVDTEHLAGMKQQALEQLEPLVGHLDQTPEESFKTTMMMIQANDNHTLLEQALEHAKQIKDDKERANAMLDIINEINYFSQVAQD